MLPVPGSRVQSYSARVRFLTRPNRKVQNFHCSPRNGLLRVTCTSLALGAIARGVIGQIFYGLVGQMFSNFTACECFGLFPDNQNCVTFGHLLQNNLIGSLLNWALWSYRV